MEKIDEQLLSMSEGNKEYAKFNKRIVNTQKIVYGVRMPEMRKLAKSISKSATVSSITELLQQVNNDVFEHIELTGLIIIYSKLDDKDKIKLIKNYLEKVDSWALVDIFTCKMTAFDDKLYWEFINQCLNSDKEFTVRYGVVSMMSNYLNPKYIDRVINTVNSINHRGYYVKMSVSWLYATAAVNFYRQAIDGLKSDSIDQWTRNKAFQKILESFRIETIQKNEVRELRKFYGSFNK